MAISSKSSAKGRIILNKSKDGRLEDGGARRDDAVRYLFGIFVAYMALSWLIFFASLYTQLAVFPKILGKLRNEKAA